MFKKLFFLVFFHLIAFTSVEPTSFVRENENYTNINDVVCYLDGVRCEIKRASIDTRTGRLRCYLEMPKYYDDIREMQDSLGSRGKNCENKYGEVMFNGFNWMINFSKGACNIIGYALDHPYVSFTASVMIYRYLPGPIQNLVYGLLKRTCVTAIKFIITVIREALKGTVLVATGSIGGAANATLEAVNFIWESIWKK